MATAVTALPDIQPLLASSCRLAQKHYLAHAVNAFAGAGRMQLRAHQGLCFHHQVAARRLTCRSSKGSTPVPHRQNPPTVTAPHPAPAHGFQGDVPAGATALSATARRIPVHTRQPVGPGASCSSKSSRKASAEGRALPE